MKIIFFIRSLARGGAERQLSILASGLNKAGYNVVVLTSYSEANSISNSNYEILKKAGVRVISLAKKGRYDIFGFLCRFISVIKSEKPNVIYSFLSLSNIIACTAKLENKNIKLIWGYRSSGLELDKYSLGLRLEHMLEKICSGIPEMIITNSYRGKEYLLQNNYKAPINVVHNGIDVDVNITSKSKEYIISMLPNLINKIIIGAVGRIDFAKDYETLIQAFNIVRQENPNVHLLIVGRESNKKYCEYLTTIIGGYGLEGKVSFMPELNEISQIYSSIDVFVSSSYIEGFSNVVAEAMLHGLPCVVTEAGDNKLLIGDAGLVVPRRDYKKLASALLKMINGNMQSYGLLARQRACMNFTVLDLVKNTARYIDSLCH